MSDDRTWPMLEPALLVSEELKPLSDNKLPHEVLRLDDLTSSIVIDIRGTDYILTMMKIPRQRERASTN